jgi:hypothetical protein
MISKAAIDMLSRANKLLTPKTWIKGKFSQLDDEGNQCFCMLGALEHVRDQVDRSDFVSVRAYNRAKEAIRASIDNTLHVEHSSIPRFNDMRSTTFDDVKRVMRNALDRYRRRVKSDPGWHPNADELPLSCF